MELGGELHEKSPEYLKHSCHLLIERISHLPGSTKLLEGAHRALLIFASHKQNRRSHSRRNQ